MALRSIRELGDPVLNKKCKEVKEVTERTKELIDDMFETMYEADGVGLAAPQVGILKRISRKSMQSASKKTLMAFRFLDYLLKLCKLQLHLMQAMKPRWHTITG